MGIIKTIRQAVGLETKNLRSEMMMTQGGSFVPINMSGDYFTLDGKGSDKYTKIAFVYAVINKIAQRASEAFLEAWAKNRKGKYDQIESDFLQFMEQPNPYQGQADFLYELAAYMMIKGEFYIWKEKNAIGGGYYLWSLPPDDITRSNGRFYYKGQLIPDQEIYYWRGFVPDYTANSDQKALSPLTVAAQNIGIIDSGQSIDRANLKTGSVPGMAYVEPINVGGGVEEAVDPLTLKEIKDDLIRQYNASAKYGEVMLVGQKVGYTKFNLSAAELKALESVEFSEKRIAMVFDYPTRLLQDKSGSLNESSRKEAYKELLLYAVFPKLEKICAVLTKVLDQRGVKIGYDKYAFPEMETDFKSMADAFDKMPYLTFNEKREALRYEPRTEPIFNELFIPSGVQTVDDFMAGPEPDVQLDPKGTY